jgi:hypothetical protein
MEELRKYVDAFKIEHPLFAREAEDLYALCVAEIEQGGSPTHEIELCYSSIDQILEDD